MRILKSGTITKSGNDVTISGPIEMLYKGYRIFANYAEGNSENQVYIFKGDVKLIGENQVITGIEVISHFKIGFYEAIQSVSDIKPGATQGQLLSDLYIKANDAMGTKVREFAQNVRATTCDLGDPHFELIARSSTVKPFKRTILRDVELQIKHKRILKLPYLVIPLDGRNDRYLPEFGKNQLEGYFVKSRWGLDSPGNTNLIARVDYFSKLGPGLGGEYRYRENRGRNEFDFYGMPAGPKTLILSDAEEVQFGRWRASLSNSYQSKNYLTAPDSIYLNLREQFSRQLRSGSVGLSYSRASTRANGFDSLQQSTGLTNEFRAGRFNSSLSANWSRYDTTSSSSADSKRQQVDVNYNARQDITKATAEFQYQRSIPIGSTSGFFTSAGATPVVSLKSDSSRLGGPKAGALWPYTAELGYGEYLDAGTGKRVDKTSFDWNLTKSLPEKHRSTLNVNTRFRQGVYSDGTAQFLLAYGGQYSYRIGKDSTYNLRYNFSRAEGFSPLSIDQSGRSDLATSDVSFKLGRKISVGAQTGYDFAHKLTNPTGSAWQSIGVRTDYFPTQQLSIRTSSVYDTILKGWSNIRGDIAYQRKAFYAALGIRFDAQRSVWADNNLYLSGLRYGKLGFDARLSYNGYLKQFTSKQLGFVYDLHDSEAVLEVTQNNTGFTPGRQINFYLRLKALPYNNLFGAGGRGQGIGTGTGRDF